MRLVITLFAISFFFACGNKNVVVSEDNKLPDHFIVDELIVQLVANVDPNVLEIKFRDQEFKLKETVSTHMRAYLYSYNDKVISPIEMKKMVEGLDETTSVEFNKKLSSRE